MTNKNQPEALRLAELLTADEWPGHMTLVSYARECVAELRRQHAELETLRTGYAAARLVEASFEAADMATAAADGFRAGVESHFSAADMAVPQYRLLHSGVDRIEDDDEFLSDDTTTWAIDPNGIFSGNIYGGHVLRPARRRIKGGQHVE